MKRFFLTVFFLIAFCVLGFSQSEIYSGGLGNRELRETGLLIGPETGVVGIGPVFLMVGANIGYQYSPHIYLGGGINFNGDPFKRGYDVYTGILGYSNVESLYGSFRWYCLDRRSSPFLEINAGIERYDFYLSYNFFANGLSFAFFSDNDYSYNSGYYPYLNIAIGYDLKNLGVKLGVCNGYKNRNQSYAYNRLVLPVFAPCFSLAYNFLITK